MGSKRVRQDWAIPKNPSQSNFKNGQSIWISIFLKEIQMTKKIHEKRLNIVNHQGNANQNYPEISPHTCQNGCHQIDKRWQVLAYTWRKWNCWWEYKLVQTLWKSVWRFLKILKIELTYDAATPLLGIYPNKNTNLKRYICSPLFTAALCTIAKTWKQSKCLSMDERIKKKHTHIYNIYTHIHSEYYSIVNSIIQYYSCLKTMKSCHLLQHG